MCSLEAILFLDEAYTDRRGLPRFPLFPRLFPCPVLHSAPHLDGMETKRGKQLACCQLPLPRRKRPGSRLLRELLPRGFDFGQRHRGQGLIAAGIGRVKLIKRSDKLPGYPMALRGPSGARALAAASCRSAASVRLSYGCPAGTSARLAEGSAIR